MSGAPTNEANASDPRRSAAALALAVLAAVTLIVAVERIAADRIEASRAARLNATLAAVLPVAEAGGDLVVDERIVRAAALGGDVPVPLYRVRHDGRTIGAALTAIAPDGYSGPIALLVGVDAGGRITGVRVTEHRETPGLGDRIERDRSDWITRFDGRSIDARRPRPWRVVRAGSDGDTEFDALSGATITSRAVVDAVRRALLWFEANREEVLDR